MHSLWVKSLEHLHKPILLSLKLARVTTDRLAGEIFCLTYAVAYKCDFMQKKANSKIILFGVLQDDWENISICLKSQTLSWNNGTSVTKKTNIRFLFCTRIHFLHALHSLLRMPTAAIVGFSTFLRFTMKLLGSIYWEWNRFAERCHLRSKCICSRIEMKLNPYWPCYEHSIQLQLLHRFRILWKKYKLNLTLVLTVLHALFISPISFGL